ncbi:LacI family transcriptional regulator [Capsulimonas corticalis]|uniref:LacI family transcriptional regulator n=1 Tax=Capsulimonas corticalis TaxID=2219043 RepID=A0A402CWR9_9BACT|nr:LacI family transcriptional regulator [Capsulimonas corticalis]
MLAAAEEIGYRPNNTARALVTGRFSSIAFWMCFDYSQHRAQVLHRMKQQMAGSGFEIIIRDLDGDKDRGPSSPQTSYLPVDGIIALDTPATGPTFARINPSASVPFVSMGGYWTGERDFVGVDLYSGTVDAITHLIETGRRNIVYVTPLPDGNEDARMTAYEKTMREAGLETRCLWLPDLSLSSVRKAANEYLQNPSNKTDALFCHNDDVALGAYRAICDIGASVGHDIALIGCDGIEECDYLACPITTISQPIAEMCTLAWEFLSRRIQEPDCPLQQRILKPKLAIRASTQP